MKRLGFALWFVIMLAAFAIPVRAFVAQGRVTRIVVEYADGTTQVFVPDSPASTPGPTFTPTSTPIPPFASPTPSVVTPTPDTEPQPDPCVATVQVASRNVRVDVWGAVSHTVSHGFTFTPQTLIHDANGNPWYGFWWNKASNEFVYAWAGGVTLVGECGYLDTAWMPPANDAGLHLIYSAREGPVLDAARSGSIGNLKGTDGTENIIRAARATSPSLLITWRNLGRLVYGVRDCPPNWGQGDPAQSATQWWSAEYATWQARGLLDVVDFFEYRNECGFVGQWEVAFDLRMVELATNAGVCLALFSDGYGNPQPWEFAERAPVLDYVQARECRPGRRHVIAYHVYEGVAGGLFKFGRWRVFQAALKDAYNDLLWLATEYGYDLGRGPVDCGAFVADWEAAMAAYAQFSEVAGFQAFSVGASPAWTDVTECLP